MDEATSALDYQSERYVQETLDAASKGRTTVVISHRLSAVRNADRILFIDKGNIIEDGSHNELIELKGNYYEMITSASNVNDEDSFIFSSTVNEKHDHHEKINGKQMFLDQQNEQDHFRDLPKDIDEEIFNTESIAYWSTFKRILVLVKPEWFHLILATLSAFLVGSSFPIFACLFGEIYGVNFYSLFYSFWKVFQIYLFRHCQYPIPLMHLKIHTFFALGF